MKTNTDNRLNGTECIDSDPATVVYEDMHGDVKAVAVEHQFIDKNDRLAIYITGKDTGIDAHIERDRVIAVLKSAEAGAMMGVEDAYTAEDLKDRGVYSPEIPDKLPRLFDEEGDGLNEGDA